MNIPKLVIIQKWNSPLTSPTTSLRCCMRSHHPHPSNYQSQSSHALSTGIDAENSTFTFTNLNKTKNKGHKGCEIWESNSVHIREAKCIHLGLAQHLKALASLLSRQSGAEIQAPLPDVNQAINQSTNREFYIHSISVHYLHALTHRILWPLGACAWLWRQRNSLVHGLHQAHYFLINRITPEMVWKGLTVADGAGPFLAPTPWLPIRVACDVRSIETSWKPRRTPGRSRMCCEAIEDVGVHAAAAVHRCSGGGCSRGPAPGVQHGVLKVVVHEKITPLVTEMRRWDWRWCGGSAVRSPECKT